MTTRRQTVLADALGPLAPWLVFSQPRNVPRIGVLPAGSAKEVDRILKGGKAADLPIEQPTKFEVAVNLRTARELRIEIPRAVTLRADHVVE
jgi:hypothetical protein